MGIWNILKDNFTRAARTRKPADVVPHPGGFRGLLLHDANNCTGCGTCTYVCSPGAITLEKKGSDAVTWQYFAGQCTYCGRCAAYCPTQAIHLEPESMPVSTNLDSLRVAHTIEMTPCARCGKPFMPLPGPLLVKLYGDPLPPDIAASRHLCEECRNKTATRNLKEAARGQLARRAADQIDRHVVD